MVTVTRARWLLRYWLLDKYHDRLRLAALGLAALIAAVALWLVITTPKPAPGAPATALVWWVQLIIMIVAAIVAYALMPKPKTPEPQVAETPVTEDGKSMRRIYGTVWTTDPAMLAWKNGTPEPIRQKAGKK